MSRELLKRALHALEVHQIEAYIEGPYLISEIRAELEKPETLDVGIVVEFAGIEGRYRLMAERLQDADH
jgi:hypothetical protein